MSEIDIATQEQLWQDPDWICSRCGFTNLAIREACRNCRYIGGEAPVYEGDCLPDCSTCAPTKTSGI